MLAGCVADDLVDDKSVQGQVMAECGNGYKLRLEPMMDNIL